MIQMIKKHWSVLLLLITIIAVSINVIYKKRVDKIHLHVKAIAVGNGWGYDVYANDSILIHQPYIPAIEGNKSFTTKEQAITIGQLVINKFKTHQSPTISVHELDSCKVVF